MVRLRAEQEGKIKRTALMLVALQFLTVLIVTTTHAGDAVSCTSLSAPGGRYVFGQISPFAKHQYMLDTKTGRLWRIMTDTDEGKETALFSVPYFRVDWDNMRKNWPSLSPHPPK